MILKNDEWVAAYCFTSADKNSFIFNATKKENESQISTKLYP